MPILLHVIIALFSLVYSTYLLFRPSKTGFHISYSLIASTVLSGAYVAWTTHSHLTSACTTGLIYLLAVTVMAAGAKYKLRQLNS